MLMELFYLRARIENSILPWQEVAIFLDDLGLHLALVSQSLDIGISNEKRREIIRKLLLFAENRFVLRNEIIDAKKIISKDQLQKAIQFTQNNKSFFDLLQHDDISLKGGKMLILHTIKELEFELFRLEELFNIYK